MGLKGSNNINPTELLMNNFTIPFKQGIYTLIIDVSLPVRIEIGKLGCTNFTEGFYAYTGSALGKTMNLKVRISRHLSQEKKRRWHIDYLLSSNAVAIKVIVYMKTSLEKECHIAKSIEQLAEVKVPIKGFGSSDCQYGCAAHLHYFPNHYIKEIVFQVTKIYEQAFNTHPSILFLNYNYKDA
jgi:Uri superfamily endonuclease